MIRTLVSNIFGIETLSVNFVTSAATGAQASVNTPTFEYFIAHTEQISAIDLRNVICSKDVYKMTSIDFAAAQQRIVERRRLRAGEERARLESQRNRHASSALNRLPFGVGQRGLEVWDSIKGREGTRPAFRVGQVDAELLDEELLELLRGQVGEGLKYFGVCYAFTLRLRRSDDGLVTCTRRLVIRDSTGTTRDLV